MALTEEEKKKQKQLSQEQANKESALDAMYNENKAYLEKQKQLKMEDAYVNRELMNKYLNESLAQQGLDKSGVANLYRQQLNTDYMNTRANIANQYDQDQLELLNQYNADKKTEQDKFQKQMYDMYTNKIASSVNDYEFIDDDTLAALNQYITDNADKLGSDYQSLLQTQLDLYKGNEEQISAYNKDKIIEENYKDYDKNAMEFANKLNELYDSNGKLTSSKAERLYEELETIKDKIGEENYKNAYYTILNSTESPRDEEKRYLKTAYPDINVDDYISLEDAKVTSFGDWVGTGSDGQQDKWVKKILDRAKGKKGVGGKLNNGDVIDFNYGAGEGNYLYYNGKFYKTSKKATIKN